MFLSTTTDHRVIGICTFMSWFSCFFEVWGQNWYYLMTHRGGSVHSKIFIIHLILPLCATLAELTSFCCTWCSESEKTTNHMRKNSPWENQYSWIEKTTSPKAPFCSRSGAFDHVKQSTSADYMWSEWSRVPKQAESVLLLLWKVHHSKAENRNILRIHIFHRTQSPQKYMYRKCPVFLRHLRCLKSVYCVKLI